MTSHPSQDTPQGLPTAAAADEARDPTPGEAAASPAVGLKGRWARLRSHWAARWALDGLMMAVVFYIVLSIQAAGLLGSGEPAPAFELRDMKGELHSLAQYQGKPVVLVFWAPWCGVCKVESGNISGVQAAYGDDVQVLSIVLGYDGLESVRRFMSEQEVDYPVLLGSRALGKQYAVDKFPTTYILDEEGRIDHALVGYTSEIGLRARLWF